MKKEKTFLGKIIKSVAGTADEILTGGKLGDVINAITGTDKLTPQEKDMALKELNMILTDVQNARNNETERDTSKEAPMLSKLIHEIIALLVIGVWIVSWFIKTVIPIEQITGAVMLILGYLYGKSNPDK